MRKVIFAAALGVATLVPAQPVIATNLCVIVSVTAPVLGTKGASPCAPTSLPEQLTIWECPRIPPAGVSSCVTVMVPWP